MTTITTINPAAVAARTAQHHRTRATLFRTLDLYVERGELNVLDADAFATAHERLVRSCYDLNEPGKLPLHIAALALVYLRSRVAAAGVAGWVAWEPHDDDSPFAPVGFKVDYSRTELTATGYRAPLVREVAP